MAVRKLRTSVYIFILIKTYILHNCFVPYSSVSTTLPQGQLSAIPWRRSGVRYTNNEAYFDVIEEVDCIIDKTGKVIFSEIQGYVSFQNN